MSRLSLKEVLARNSDDESDDFSQLDSASQARGRGSQKLLLLLVGTVCQPRQPNLVKTFFITYATICTMVAR